MNDKATVDKIKHQVAIELWLRESLGITEEKAEIISEKWIKDITQDE